VLLNWRDGVRRRAGSSNFKGGVSAGDAPNPKGATSISYIDRGCNLWVT